MLKLVHDRIWFFDIEWVPDARAGKVLYGLEDDLSEAEIMQKMWDAAGATAEKPRPWVKTALCRIASIAFLQRQKDKDGNIIFSLHSLPKSPVDKTGLDEAQILEMFLTHAGKIEPQLVGFNSVQSDITILVQRALANEISAGKFAARPNKPWEGKDYFSDFSDYHVDLKSIFGGSYSNSVSLNEMATVCKIPGKIDVSGVQVADLWLQGKFDEIVAYNEFDVITTYLLWLRVAKFSGKVSETAYFEEIESFKEFLMTEAEKRPHLDTYIEKWAEVED